MADPVLSAAGKLSVHVSHAFPMDHAHLAFKAVADRKAVGKVVVVPPGGGGEVAVTSKL